MLEYTCILYMVYLVGGWWASDPYLPTYIGTPDMPGPGAQSLVEGGA